MEHQSDRRSRGGEHQPLPQHHSHDVRAPRAEGDADADLAASPRDGVAGHTVDPDCGKQQPDDPECS
jgi:hypothetical protein